MRSIRAWFFLAFMVLGGPLFALGTIARNVQLGKIIDHGKLILATIEKIEWKTRQGQDTDYMATVTYVPPGTQPFSTKVGVDSAVGLDVRNHKVTTIKLAYLPEDPKVAYAENATGPSTVGIYLGGAMFVVGAAIASMMLYRRFRRP